MSNKKNELDKYYCHLDEPARGRVVAILESFSEAGRDEKKFGNLLRTKGVVPRDLAIDQVSLNALTIAFRDIHPGVVKRIESSGGSVVGAIYSIICTAAVNTKR